MSAIPSLTILSEEQKFNGDNLLQWNSLDCIRKTPNGLFCTDEPIVRSYLNEENKCNDNSYTRYFNGLYYIQGN